MEKMHPSGRLIHIAEIRKAFIFMTRFIITFKCSQLLVGNDRWVGLSDSEISASEIVTSFEIRGGQLLDMASGVQSTVHLFLHTR